MIKHIFPAITLYLFQKSYKKINSSHEIKLILGQAHFEKRFIMYTISQVSAMFDLPVSTLRYYDKEGFFPNLERKGNIRYFSDNELEALRIIECLKKSGLAIKDIKQFCVCNCRNLQKYRFYQLYLMISGICH